jgi:copper(I)-binding protein
VAAVLGAGALTGCAGGGGSEDGANGGGAPRLKVTGAFLPRPVTTGMAAGFLTVHNTGGADTLTSASSALAARVTLHATQGSAMRHQDSFPVPAHGALSFAHGANHLMFEQLTHVPEVGESVPVQLHFKRSGTVSIRIPVRPATYRPADPADPAGPTDPAGLVDPVDPGGLHSNPPANSTHPNSRHSNSTHPNSPNSAMPS